MLLWLTRAWYIYLWISLAYMYCWYSSWLKVSWAWLCISVYYCFSDYSMTPFPFAWTWISSFTSFTLFMISAYSEFFNPWFNFDWASLLLTFLILVFWDFTLHHRNKKGAPPCRSHAEQAWKGERMMRGNDDVNNEYPYGMMTHVRYAFPALNKEGRETFLRCWP